MNIGLTTYNNPNFGAKFYDKFFEKLPNKNITNPEKLNKFGHVLASPHWNRAILGAAAILTQPLIDYKNPKVDNETATTSALRTIGKICACTAVGFLVRGSMYKLINKYVKEGGSKFLIPDAILNEKSALKRENMLKLHKNTLSTLTALGVMIFTNFLLDAPLTTLTTNELMRLRQKYLAKKAV